MYKSLIEPHLTYDCEAALDVRPSSLKPLTTVQPTLLRRALEIGPSVTTHNSLPGDKNMAAAIWPRGARPVMTAEACGMFFATSRPWLWLHRIRATVDIVAALFADLEYSLALHLYQSVMES
ncbi:hypothetical protein OH76DRAFT_1558554 [Lentinus brumalis]|uniref:Uncharacterized protein n=1 Tax=Lentinus brumalis TaxID=2498619 RepID=A0A371D123_9APHY|nr:hypothetical protein OH76DRAFT_1558554 [Polyporus brumalis]